DPAVTIGHADYESTLCVAYRGHPIFGQVMEGDQVQETTRVHGDGKYAERLAVLEDGNIGCCRPPLIGSQKNVGNENRTGFKRLVLRCNSLFAPGRRQQGLTSLPIGVYKLLAVNVGNDSPEVWVGRKTPAQLALEGVDAVFQHGRGV